MTKKANAAEITDHDALFKKWGGYYGVDWRLIKAHAMRESSLDPAAFNAERPDLVDDGSYGLMQVYCIVGADGYCRNKLNVSGWPARPEQLLDAEYNVMIGAQIIAANIRMYGMPRAVAVYNSFDQHTAPLNGPFKNQSYVDDVLEIYRDLGGK